MKILANDGIAAGAKARLEELGHEVDTQKYEGDDLLKQLKEVDCIVVRSATKMRNEQIDAGAEGNLKLIIRAGVGVDNINVDYAKEKGIEVRNTPAASTNAVAELALAHMMMLARHLQSAQRTMPEGKWLKKEYKGTEIMGKTLGLIGMGRIGHCLAQKAKALGMKIVYYDIKRNEEYEKELDAEFMETDELLKVADYISIHTPYLGKPALGKDEFAKMKKGVIIVNAARGGTIDESALLEAIDNGTVAACGLDVYEKEPLDKEELMKCDKISFSPHIGAATVEAQDRIGDIIVDIVEEMK